jgi:hypothetical protein
LDFYTVTCRMSHEHWQFEARTCRDCRLERRLKGRPHRPVCHRLGQHPGAECPADNSSRSGRARTHHPRTTEPNAVPLWRPLRGIRRVPQSPSCLDVRVVSRTLSTGRQRRADRPSDARSCTELPTVAEGQVGTSALFVWVDIDEQASPSSWAAREAPRAIRSAASSWSVGRDARDGSPVVYTVVSNDLTFAKSTKQTASLPSLTP